VIRGGQSLPYTVLSERKAGVEEGGLKKQNRNLIEREGGTGNKTEEEIF